MVSLISLSTAAASTSTSVIINVAKSSISFVDANANLRLGGLQNCNLQLMKYVRLSLLHIAVNRIVLPTSLLLSMLLLSLPRPRLKLWQISCFFLSLKSNPRQVYSHNYISYRLLCLAFLTVPPICRLLLHMVCTSNLISLPLKFSIAEQKVFSILFATLPAFLTFNLRSVLLSLLLNFTWLSVISLLPMFLALKNRLSYALSSSCIWC